MRGALHAEWTKLRTVPGTGWLLLGLLTLTLAVSAGAAATVTCPWGRCTQDTVRFSLIGVQAGQALAALLAVSAIGGEHSTGMTRATLTAVPCRVRVLVAKAIVVGALTGAVGAVAVVASVLAGRLVLPGRGYPALSLTDGPTLRAVVGSVLYLVLIGLLSLGVAAAVRDAAAAIGGVLGLLYLVPVIVLLTADPGWQRLLWSISPANAGLAVQATTQLSALPLGPWAGLGVVAVWAGAALLCGALLLRARDA